METQEKKTGQSELVILQDNYFKIEKETTVYVTLVYSWLGGEGFVMGHSRWL